LRSAKGLKRTPQQKCRWSCLVLGTIWGPNQIKKPKQNKLVPIPFRGGNAHLRSAKGLKSTPPKKCRWSCPVLSTIWGPKQIKQPNKTSLSQPPLGVESAHAVDKRTEKDPKTKMAGTSSRGCRPTTLLGVESAHAVDKRTEKDPET
jgi:hypothetical protein